MNDSLLTCLQCGNQFIIKADEREKLEARGFDLPKRCPECRRHKNRDTGIMSEAWDHKRKRKQSRKEKDFFDEGI